MLPGVVRQPPKNLEPDPDELHRLLERWRAATVKTGRTIERIVLACKADRDGFWLARWLQARGFEVHVIHSTGIAVSREHRRAMLMPVFLGWPRGGRGQCRMVAIPSIEEEDASRASRERESLVEERSRITNRMHSTLARLGSPLAPPHSSLRPQWLAAETRRRIGAIVLGARTAGLISGSAGESRNIACGDPVRVAMAGDDCSQRFDQAELLVGACQQ